MENSELIIQANNCYNMDCKAGMELMLRQGLRADWVITDPPYGIGLNKMSLGGGEHSSGIAHRDYGGMAEWDNERIQQDIFDLIFALSDNQIIFGGNYYADILPPTKSWVVWDKRLYDKRDRNDYADCELAWCSCGVARVFGYVYNGMLQGDTRNKDPRFHPTQKPTQIWIKLLNYYTKEGDLILDPFAGSQSLRIACHKTRRKFIGFEIDKGFYEKGCKWYEEETRQLSMFDMPL